MKFKPGDRVRHGNTGLELTVDHYQPNNKDYFYTKEFRFCLMTEFDFELVPTNTSITATEALQLWANLGKPDVKKTPIRRWENGEHWVEVKLEKDTFYTRDNIVPYWNLINQTTWGEIENLIGAHQFPWKEVTVAPQSHPKKTETAKHKCRCEWVEVLSHGCKCGGV